MGLYTQHIVPRIVNVACGMKANAPLRERTCAGLAGNVVEIGFGSGHNVPFYPDTVIRVAAVEPSDIGWRLAEERVAAPRSRSNAPGLDGQSLPFPDDTFDAALSTWTLCTIPDLDAALAEVRRVLKPGGSCISSSTGSPPTTRSSAGSTGSSHSRSGCSAAATSPVRSFRCSRAPASSSPTSTSSTRTARPKFLAADSLGTATSPG